MQNIRAARAKQQAMQQAAQNAPQLASALEDASQATTDNPNSVLGKILNSRNAVNTLNATQRPPQSLVA